MFLLLPLNSTPKARHVAHYAAEWHDNSRFSSTLRNRDGSLSCGASFSGRRLKLKGLFSIFELALSLFSFWSYRAEVPLKLVRTILRQNRALSWCKNWERVRGTSCSKVCSHSSQLPWTYKPCDDITHTHCSSLYYGVDEQLIYASIAAPRHCEIRHLETVDPEAKDSAVSDSAVYLPKQARHARGRHKGSFAQTSLLHSFCRALALRPQVDRSFFSRPEGVSSPVSLYLALTL